MKTWIDGRPPKSVVALGLLAAAGLPAARAQAVAPKPVSAETVTLPVFQVNDKNDVGYQAGNTISATRLDTPVYKH